MDERDSFESIESTLKIRELILSDHVGFDSLPYQIVKKRTQDGYAFNILLIGETGIGKSTLISSLFDIPSNSTKEPHSNSEVKLKVKKHKLVEKGVNLQLTVIETVGYGDQISREDNLSPIVKYIDTQYDKYLKEELKIKRDLSLYRDSRVHVCLYFICPTGHSLKALDLYSMRHLQNKINIIPIVAKADSLSKAELNQFKAAVRTELDNEKIKIYQFPTDDEAIASANLYSNANIPFAVAASGDYVSVGDKSVRARVFPWGTMLVEDEEHSEFLLLKDMLIQTNMEDLREKTNDEHYEFYRKLRIDQLGYLKQFSSHEMHKLKEELQREMLEKEKKLKEIFVEKVKEKELKLNEQEKLIHSRYKSLFQILKTEEKSILNEKEVLEREICEFQRQKRAGLLRSTIISSGENDSKEEIKNI